MGLIVAIPINGDRQKNNRITFVEGDAKRDALIVISGLVWFSKIVSSTVSCYSCLPCQRKIHVKFSWFVLMIDPIYS